MKNLRTVKYRTWRTLIHTHLAGKPSFVHEQSLMFPLPARQRPGGIEAKNREKDKMVGKRRENEENTKGAMNDRHVCMYGMI